MPFRYNTLRRFDIGFATPDAIAANVKIEINNVEKYNGLVQTTAVTAGDTSWAGYQVISVYEYLDTGTAADIKITALDNTVIFAYCHEFFSKISPRHYGWTDLTTGLEVPYTDPASYTLSMADAAENSGNLTDQEWASHLTAVQDWYENTPGAWRPGTHNSAMPTVSFSLNGDPITPEIHQATGARYWIPMIAGDVAIKTVTVVGNPEIPNRVDWALNTDYTISDMVYYGGDRYRVMNPFTSGATFDATDLVLLDWSDRGNPPHSGA